MQFTALALSLSAICLLLFPTALAGGCSGGVQVCCGSSSVGCSGNICKACCGNTCGCFYYRSSTCSSQTTPCVDVTKPDFPTINGECKAPSSSSGGSGGSGGSTGGSSGAQSSLCASVKSGYLRRLLGCPS